MDTHIFAEPVYGLQECGWCQRRWHGVGETPFHPTSRFRIACARPPFIVRHRPVQVGCRRGMCAMEPHPLFVRAPTMTLWAFLRQAEESPTTPPHRTPYTLSPTGDPSQNRCPLHRSVGATTPGGSLTVLCMRTQLQTCSPSIDKSAARCPEPPRPHQQCNTMRHSARSFATNLSGTDFAPAFARAAGHSYCRRAVRRCGNLGPFSKTHHVEGSRAATVWQCQAAPTQNISLVPMFT